MASEVKKILAIFEEVILGHKLRPDQRDALLHKISPLLTTYIDSVVEQKVLEGQMDLLERIHCCDNEPAVEDRLPINVCSGGHTEHLATLRHRYEQMKGEVK